MKARTKARTHAPGSMIAHRWFSLALFCLMLLGMTLFVACPARAQNVRAPFKPIASELLSPAACQFPAVAGQLPQRVAVKLGDLALWCVEDAAIAAARAAGWSAAVDGGAAAALEPACRPPDQAGGAVLCYATLPASTVAALARPGIHTLAITTPAIAAGGLTLTQQIERPSCPAFGVTYDIGAPLPNTPASVAAGALYSTAGTVNVELLIGKLRADGWQIEWMRQQWEKVPTTQSQINMDPGGAYWVLGWCRGTPQ